MKTKFNTLFAAFAAVTMLATPACDSGKEEGDKAALHLNDAVSND